MKISTKGRYALRLMLDIAENGHGNVVPLKDISARQGISVKYLEQIVGTLSKAGLLKSVRGPQGGYRLMKAPEECTVGSILRLTEGNLAPVACLEDEKNQCSRCDECETIDFWIGLNKLINEYIDSYTLADLLRSKRQRAGDDFCI